MRRRRRRRRTTTTAASDELRPIRACDQWKRCKSDRRGAASQAKLFLAAILDAIPAPLTADSGRFSLIYDPSALYTAQTAEIYDEDAVEM